MNYNHQAIGADVGGSHITVGLVDLESKSISSLMLYRSAVDPGASAEQILECWTRAISQLMQFSKDLPVCFAMPGPFDYENGICLVKGQNKFAGLYGKNIKSELAGRLNCPEKNLYFKNDAEAFLDGEICCGSVTNAGNVIGITLGTGFGSAIYSNGECREGSLWNVPFKNGVAEDYISSRWFVSKYQELTGKKIHGVKELTLLSGEHEIAKIIFDEFALNLSEFLVNFAETNKTDAIVIGGNISRAYDFFKDTLHEKIHKSYPDVAIHKSVLGESGAILGACSSLLNLKNHRGSVSS
ncbi:MAG TPA: ROK family protein [Flavitalea sp.]|nr:ROK family protein [Flavitalea sp.]